MNKFRTTSIIFELVLEVLFVIALVGMVVFALKEGFWIVAIPPLLFASFVIEKIFDEYI